MGRETAVTNEVTYSTQECHLCEREVATDQAAPSDTFEPNGFAVVLGEGELQTDVEHDANWDREFTFAFSEDEGQLPTVEGYIICEECAQSFHEHPDNARNYTGKIHSELLPGRNPSLDQTTLVILGVIAVLIILILMIL